MNEGESSLLKQKRRTVQDIFKNDLDNSKIKLKNELNASVSPVKRKINNLIVASQGNMNIDLSFKKRNKKVSFLPNMKNRHSIFVMKRNNVLDCSNLENKKIKRKSQKFEMQSKKLFEFYNIKKEINANNSRLKKRNNVSYNLNQTIKLNKIEENIINVINNMRKRYEKESRIKMAKTVSPNIVLNKSSSSPNLKIYFKNKKKKKKKHRRRHESLLIKETNVLIPNDSFKTNLKKKRNKSFDFNDQYKKKIIRKIKNKIVKNSNQRLTLIGNYSLNEDIENNNDSCNSFVFLPNSRFIFIFDFLLIISDLYVFIFIPLTVAQNKDMRERGPILQEILNYIIEVIFILDFIISFFRGYYNYEMNLITNNKKIIIHYFKKCYFIFDFFQAIPLFLIIRIFNKPNKFFYLTYTGKESAAITFFLFIKPFKICKILENKQNKALEEFYSYLQENYYLEKLVRFLIYFLCFLLFVHLFICLHIYCSFQSYPNWITNTNIINETFLIKYITSFYFMITTMTTVGYGDIVCISLIERIYHIILLVLGTLLYTFLVSKIGNYLRDQSYVQTKLDKDLNILENIRISYPQMPFKLYSKIKSHLLSNFKRRKKTGISLLINGVPDAIKNDLLFKIYSKVINRFNFFKNVKNSNFIVQVLTSFIPIVSKKEEIIILEGEILQNIIFVKDGRLSTEIAIDLNNPYLSFHKYLEINFVGISREEELKNHKISKRNSYMNLPEQNYNDLKDKIDNILLDNKRTLINNSIMGDNGISIDLCRLDFSRNNNDINEDENFQILKIRDIRKNEYFGDVHLFTENPCPFMVKAKSRIAELFLLRKHDAIIISSNFPNIWKRIQNKSYHNLVSIKKLTFKILKQYFNTNLYNKNIKEKNSLFKFDTTKYGNSEFSISENKPSFIKKNNNNKSDYKSFNKSYNQSSSKSFAKFSCKSVNKTLNKFKNNILEKVKLKPTKTKNPVNKNKLFVTNNLHKRQNSKDSITDNLKFSYDSLNSQNNSYQSSNFEFSKFVKTVIKKPEEKKNISLVININKEEDEVGNNKEVKKSSYSNKNNLKVTIDDDKNVKLNRINNEFTFKSENQINKISLVSQKLLKLKKSHNNNININSGFPKNNISFNKPSNKTIKTIKSDSIINSETLNLIIMEIKVIIIVRIF